MIKQPRIKLECQSWRSVALAAAAGVTLAILPGRALAESGFRVSPATGLELGPGSAAADSGSAGRAKPKAGAPESGEKKPTEITASKETTFDEKSRVAVFLGDVTVNDPQFKLTCEKLTAYLKKATPQPDKGNPGDGAKPVANPSPSPEKASEKPGKENGGDDAAMGGGLERAVAEGDVIIVQEKTDDKGEVTRYVGKAAKADYNATTGDVTLTGWPQIQQGPNNNQVATDEGTVMILNRSGHLKTIGPSKTEISSSDSSKTQGKAGETKGNKPETSRTSIFP